jgi:hypothetical protein
MLTAGLLFGFGCGGDDDDDNGTGPNGDDPLRGGSINIEASSGTTPTYTWDGGPLISLHVVPASDTTSIAWGIASTTESDVISSPLEHGTVPANTIEIGDAASGLEEGTTYRVIAGREDESYSWVEFTP